MSLHPDRGLVTSSVCAVCLSQHCQHAVQLYREGQYEDGDDDDDHDSADRGPVISSVWAVYLSQHCQHAVQLNREGQSEDGGGGGDDRASIIISLYGVYMYS